VDLPKTFEAATQADGDEVEISGQLRSVKGDAMARALEAPDFPAPVWAAGTMASIYAPYVNEMPPVYIVQGEPYEEGERRATDVQPVTGFIPHRASRSSLHYAFQWFGVCGLAILIWIMLAVHPPAVAQPQEKSATETQ